MKKDKFASKEVENPIGIIEIHTPEVEEIIEIESSIPSEDPPM